MRTRIRLLVPLLAVVVICVAPVHAAESPAREHPYLFFTKQDIPRLKARLEQPTIAAVWQSVQAAALRAPARRGGGPDVLCAGIAYQLTGDSRYAEAGVSALMAGVTDPQPWIVPSPEIKVLQPGHGQPHAAHRVRLRPALRRHDGRTSAHSAGTP